MKTLDFFAETLPTFSANISLNRSDSEKSFGLFEVYVTCLNRLQCIFLLIFVIIFLDFPPQKWLIHNDKNRGCHLLE